jgi:uncharacterized phage infection (PIP) family protein YhgE
MSNQHIEKTREELIEKSKFNIGELIKSTYHLCELTKNSIAHLREVRDFLSIFSAEEIMAINEAERTIPTLISELAKLMHALNEGTFEINYKSQHRKKLDEIQAKREEIASLIETMATKIPEPKVSLLTWLILPYTLIEYFIKKYIHKIRMKRTEESMEKLKAKKQEFIKKREEIERKKEELLKSRKEL